MIIQSKFKDYYDTVMGQGIDKTLVYDRTQIEFDVDTANQRRTHDIKVYEFCEEFRNIPVTYRWNADYSSFHSSLEAYPLIIGFCGKIYFGYDMDYMDSKEFCFSPEAVENFVKATTEEKYQKYIAKEKVSSFLYSKIRFTKQNVDKVFIQFDDNAFLQDLFVKYKCPCFSIEYYRGKTHFTINPELKTFDFKKVVNPYQAFQEISMYLGGVLGCGNPEMIKISDKELAKKHGMDKTSFRVPSPGKKFKRRS